MGESSTRSVDCGSRGQRWKDLSSRRQGRKGVGEGHLAECRVVRGEELLRESGPGTYRASRFAENLCEAVPQQRRRVGADSVPAGPRIGADNGTLSRLQTESRSPDFLLL